MQAATASIKTSEQLGQHYAEIDKLRFNNNLDGFREMDGDARSEFVNQKRNEYAKMIDDEVSYNKSI